MAILLFYQKDVGRWMDGLTRILGAAMVLLTLWMVVKADPPLTLAVQKSFLPDQFNAFAILTLVGGTVGGYISFAGGHRLLDAGIKGPEQVPAVNCSAGLGIGVTATMRIFLFLAVLGVVHKGMALGNQNPAAAVFRAAAGPWGEKFFGVVMWCAGITSVVGAAYTSLSFLKPLHPIFVRQEKPITAGFVLFSALVFVGIGQPVKVLVTVGALNGLVLPFALVLLLLSLKTLHQKMDLRYPVWLLGAGWAVAAIMGVLAFLGFRQWLATIA
ncbi:MAG: divalent metal cation transporter [Sphingobacteriia bacterium]|nr:MAG: divalent metal cation transporter [Sphingobacteriia bacterium]